MGLQKNTGIIIRLPTSLRPRLIVLDKKLGKIIAITAHQQLQRGALLEYTVQRRGNAWLLEHVELCVIPCDIAREDILFLHHMLELCYYFVPVGTCVRDLVVLLSEVLNHHYVLCEVGKKSVIFKMLTLLGVYPDESNIDAKQFHRLATESVDTVRRAILELNIEKKLDNWLHSCIASHPHAKYLKTLSFYRHNFLGTYE